MQIQVVSDLHLEFQPIEVLEKFVKELATVNPDVLALPGDITSVERLMITLATFADYYDQVVYVPGNHEFYGANPSVLAKIREEVTKGWRNVHWLDESEITIGKQRFVGATLWFPEPQTPQQRNAKANLSDFSNIGGFEPWVYTKHDSSMRYLESALRPGDIAVTHHLPSLRSVHPKYKNDVLNYFFATNLEHVFRLGEPRVWIHGHTHESVDYTCEGTRVVCNPRGYWPNDLNRKFNEGLVINV